MKETIFDYMHLKSELEVVYSTKQISTNLHDILYMNTIMKIILILL